MSGLIVPETVLREYPERSTSQSVVKTFCSQRTLTSGWARRGLCRYPSHKKNRYIYGVVEAHKIGPFTASGANMCHMASTSLIGPFTASGANMCHMASTSFKGPFQVIQARISFFQVHSS